MYIINEWLHYLNNPEEDREPPWEFELRCRVHLIGIINLGWASFRFWEPPLQRVKSDVRSVLLRMSFRNIDTDEFLKVPNEKDQHYHPSGPAGEFESLISLFTRAHFVLVRGSFTGNLPSFRRFSDQGNVAHSDFDGTSIRLEEIQPYFDMMRVIRSAELIDIAHNRSSERYVKKFVMAARFYHLAQSLIEHDETLAYMCLVCA
jgi:hypothetical protein